MGTILTGLAFFCCACLRIALEIVAPGTEDRYQYDQLRAKHSELETTIAQLQRENSDLTEMVDYFVEKHGGDLQ